MGLKASYRWCLSGTPIHNSLDDYGALLTFVGVDPFHEKTMFETWIASPVKENPRVGIPRLKDLVRGTCLRRTKASPTVHLHLLEPIKNIEYVNLNDEDQALYVFFRKKTADIAINTRAANQAKSNTATEESIISHMNMLRLICNHGKALLPPQALVAWHRGSSSETDWQMGIAFQAGCRLCGVDLGNLNDDDSRPSSPAARHRESLCETCYSTDKDSPGSKISKYSTARKQEVEKVKASEPTQPSAKMEALLKNLFRDQNAETEGLVANKRLVQTLASPSRF
jgi:SNF2 family DNA or RNA helicase